MIQTAWQWSPFKASPVWPWTLSPRQWPLSFCSSGSSHTGLSMLPEQASSCLHRGPIVAILPPLPPTLSIRKPNSLTPFKSVFVFTLVLEAFDYSTSNDRMVPIRPSFLFKHYCFHSIDLCLKLHVFHWHVYCWPFALDGKLRKGKALYPQSHT